MEKTDSCRRVSKPLMEKRRRARINQSLTELKSLILSTARSEAGHRHSKLEKADILEMTVSHLQELHRQKKLSINEKSPDEIQGKFRAGFEECLRQIDCYFNRNSTEVAVDVRQQIVGHLNQKLDSLQDNNRRCQCHPSPCCSKMHLTPRRLSNGDLLLVLPSELTQNCLSDTEDESQRSVSSPSIEEASDLSGDDFRFDQVENQEEAVWRPW